MKAVQQRQNRIENICSPHHYTILPFHAS